jgi:hypothetical protein
MKKKLLVLLCILTVAALAMGAVKSAIDVISLRSYNGATMSGQINHNAGKLENHDVFGTSYIVGEVETYLPSEDSLEIVNPGYINPLSQEYRRFVHRTKFPTGSLATGQFYRVTIKMKITADLSGTPATLYYALEMQGGFPSDPIPKTLLLEINQPTAAAAGSLVELGFLIKIAGEVDGNLSIQTNGVVQSPTRYLPLGSFEGQTFPVLAGGIATKKHTSITVNPATANYLALGVSGCSGYDLKEWHVERLK